MNDLYEECIDTANYIAEKITDKTGFKAFLKKIGESLDEDDYYILFRMTINGKNYKLYAGEEDFTIVGEDDDTYIESTGFNTNNNIEDFCEELLEGIDESTQIKVAKQILKENGFICEAKQNEIVLLDTRSSNVPVEVVRNWKDDETIEEDSDEYWDAVNEMSDVELDDFRTDAAFNFDLGKCLVKATAGLWNGNSDGAGIRVIESGADILNCLSRDCDNVKIVLNEDGLVMYGYHHDGTNVYKFYKLNDKGVAYWEDHEDDYNESKILQNLFNGKMVKKITKEMIGF